MSYIQRYEQGRHQQVWEELVTQGSLIYDEPLLAEARAVAQLMMRRAQHNVEHLVERLQAMGYRFTQPPLRPPDPALLRQLDTIEQQHGRLPLVVRVWFETVGQVSFLGFHPTLSDPSSPHITDPVEICLKDIYTDTSQGRSHAFLALGEDSCVKRGEMCEGGPMSVVLPSPTFDAPFYGGDTWAEDYGGSEWDGEFFVPYLRLCFQYGGFPGIPKDFDPDLAARYEAELSVLTRDLLPL